MFETATAREANAEAGAAGNRGQNAVHNGHGVEMLVEGETVVILLAKANHFTLVYVADYQVREWFQIRILSR